VVTATSGALSESTPITITGGPVFTLTKTSIPAPGTTISPTDTITYYIVVTNTGTDSSGFVLTDTIPTNSQYVSGSASSNGNIVSLTPDLVVTRSMTSGAVLTVTFAVTSTGGGSINNQVTIFSDQTGQQTSSTVSHPLGGAGGLYLPIVMKAWDGTAPPTPTGVNLVVDRIEFAGTAPVNPGDLYHVRVVARNAGTQTLTTDFWVDLYLNPVSTPAPNQPWQTLSQSGEQGVGNCDTDETCYGRAWYVTADLAPGEAITLTTSQATDARYDRWPSAGAPHHSRHTPIVALVDSWSSLGNSYGAIYESNEGDNLSGSLTVTGMAGNQLILDLPPGSPSPAGGKRPTLPGVPE
jgi:uncharacterized repeat protein (TIGR01451 family)